MIRILLLISLLSTPLHAEIFNCSSLTGEQFVAELASQEKKFKEEVSKREFEELHKLVDTDPFFEMGLMLWPEYMSDKVFYTEAFDECSGDAQNFIKTIPEKSSNDELYVEWEDCLRMMYKENRSAAAQEVDQCFAKYRRK